MTRRMPPLVFLLLTGGGLLSILRFMAMPFLALYLHKVTGAPPPVVGAVIGLSAISNLLSGFILGPLSDRLGRKPSIIIGSLISGVTFMGYAFAQNLFAFGALQLLAGMSWAIMGPAFMALLTDLTPEPMRVRVFGYSYWVTNIGAAVGPILGTLAGSGKVGLPFILVGGASILLAAVFLFVLPTAVGFQPLEKRTAMDSLRHMGEALQNRTLALFFLGSAITAMAYSQVDTNIPQYLSLHVANGLHLYAYLISANALTVLVLQPLLSRWQERKPLVWGVAGGALIYAVANASYILATSAAQWILVVVIFTVGEVLLSPGSQAVVAKYAPPDRRATYFTLQNAQWSVSAFIGPVLGGLALVAGGKAALFGSMAVFNLVAVLVFLKALGPIRRREASVDVETAS